MADRQGSAVRTRPDARRLAAGAGWGAVAALVMGAVMLGGTAAGVSPMPKPIPAALVAHVLGPLPKPGMIALAALAHLGYGAAAGAVLAGLPLRVTLPRALGYGAVLWALMGLAWLPFLGWGLFGAAITVKITAATLLLHLIYGLTLGLPLARARAAQPAPATR